MIDDFEQRYRAVMSRDARFDGMFFTAVTSTHIYCRPSCPAKTPQRKNVLFFTTAAAAQAAGFRACKRCRPDAAPGSPEWNGRTDIVARAMHLIRDGVADRGGIPALASRLAVSERHLHRLLTAELGAGPQALARAQRAETARILIETTAMPFTDAAFAAGFSSLRQFNDTVREIYAASPTELRGRRRNGVVGEPGQVSLRLAYRRPYEAQSMFRFLGERTLDGVEEMRDGVYRRTLSLPRGAAIVELADADGHIACTLRLEHMSDLVSAVTRVRRLLDLDADSVAVDEQLLADPLLRPEVQRHPGRRVPGTASGTEAAIRAVVGQQVSVAGARTVITRLVAACAVESPLADATLTHLFPSADALLEMDPSHLAMPQARRNAMRGLISRIASGDLTLDPSADAAAEEAAMLALPGIGPWTVNYISMRALRNPDAFPATDLGVVHGLRHLGRDATPKEIATMAAAWSPWRAYAVQHIWNAIPPTPTRKR